MGYRREANNTVNEIWKHVHDEIGPGQFKYLRMHVCDGQVSVLVRFGPVSFSTISTPM